MGVPAALRTLLVIGATPEELAPIVHAVADPAAVAHGGVIVDVRPLGVGKCATAAGLARALAEASAAGRPFDAVVQVGIGGTYAGSFLPVGGVAVATSEHDLDFGVRYRHGWRGADDLGFPLVRESAPNAVPVDPDLSAWLSHRGRVPAVPFGTSDAVSGDLDEADARRQRFDLAVESMEGSAAALTALSLGVPFAEVRGISNVAGQRDHATWEVRAAVQAAARVLLGALRR